MALKYGVVTPTPNQYLITSASPIDPRSLVDEFKDLIDYNGWKAPGAAGNNAGNVFTYFGMQTTVAKDSVYNGVTYPAGVYQFLNNSGNDSLSPISESAVSNPSNWVRISVQSNVVEGAIASNASAIEGLDTKIDELEAADIAYTREGKDYTDVAGAIADLYTGLASAGTQEGINDLINRVGTAEGKITELETAVNGTAEDGSDSLQSQITTLSGKVDAIHTFSVEVVDALPEAGEEKVIYMIPEVDKDGNKLTTKAEYLWIKDSEGNYKWELVGTTHTSLSGYATEAYVTTEIGKATTAANGYTDTEIATALETAQGYANTAEGNAKTYAEGQAAQALADAKTYVGEQLVTVNENIGKKLDTETYNSDKETLNQRLTGIESTNQTQATDITNLQTAVSTKVEQEAYNSKIGDIEDAIAELPNQYAAKTLEETVTNLTKTVGDNKTAAETAIKEAKDLAQEAKDGLADKVTNSSLATTLASYQTQDLTITDFDTEGVQATVESALLANKNAMAANATAISGLSGRMDAVETLAGDAATKASVEALAGETGRVTVVEGKVSTLEGVVGDASKGLVKDVADLSANKADAATVESTYLKKSGDISLELGSEEANGVIKVNDYSWGLEYPFAETIIDGGTFYSRISDEGITEIRGGKINVHGGDYSKPEILISANAGISGALVDTAIPSTPEDGHIATTGAIKTYVDAEVKSVKDSVATAYKFKGPKTYEQISATTDAKVGDVYNCTTEVTLNGVKYPVGTNFAWDGEAWEPLSGIIDISAYATTASVTEALEAQAESFQGIIDGVEGEVEKKAAIDGSNLGTLSDTAKASWKSALGFATADDQVQSDWNVTDTSSKAYIANKPDVKKYDANATVIGSANKSSFGDSNNTSHAIVIPTAYSSSSGGLFHIEYGTIANTKNKTVDIRVGNYTSGYTIIVTSTAGQQVRYDITEFAVDPDDPHGSKGVEITKEAILGDSSGVPTIVNISGIALHNSYRSITFSDTCSYEVRSVVYEV